jgi:hypothetical protein
MPVDFSRLQVSDYDVTWGSYALGSVDKVTPKLTLKLKEIKVGTLGDVVIGKRIIGLEGTVEVECREIDIVAIKGLMPWSAAAGNASPGTSVVQIPLVPALFHKDLYDYALALKLHPTHMGADVSTDMNLLKAVPHMSYLGERDGVGDNKVLLEFEFFPDRGSLSGTPPTLSYGTIG